MRLIARRARAACVATLLMLGPTRTGAAAPAPRLLSTDTLAAWLASGAGVTVVDVRQPWTSYLQNHLPNAAWLNIETLRSTNAGLPFQLFSAEGYSELFTRVGIRSGRPVVVYSAGDQLDIDATFAAWLIAGFDQAPVYLLDGGYAKWELEGRSLTQEYPHQAPQGKPLDRKHFSLATASLAEVQGSLGKSGTLLVDARPPEQFGGTAGAQRRRGHIPGAINHPWKTDLESRDLVTVWKLPDSLRAGYSAQGITPDKNIIVYCNSSTEASHLFFALRYLLGYPRVRIYAGAWSEWAERMDLPIE
jgi:thiosulfate/3-mercaptopyruvate sulfurtransferase